MSICCTRWFEYLLFSMVLAPAVFHDFSTLYSMISVSAVYAMISVTYVLYDFGTRSTPWLQDPLHSMISVPDVLPRFEDLLNYVSSWCASWFQYLLYSMLLVLISCAVFQMIIRYQTWKPLQATQPNLNFTFSTKSLLHSRSFFCFFVSTRRTSASLNYVLLISMSRCQWN